MLALTRRKGESIIIDGNIEVVIIGVQGEQVRLGIEAPKYITINRKEIHDQIMAANKESASKINVDGLKDLM